MRREASSIKIQKNMRRHLSRKAYNSIQLSALDLQTCARAAAARNQLINKKRTKASIKIQAQWRGHREYNNYYQSKRAALISQSRWRGRLGRKELKKLKVAAKESGALKEAKDKLEKKVEELTSRLQYETHRRHELVEEKEEEISKLQELLKDMRMKVDEANSLLALERDNAKKLIEEASAAAAVNDSENIKALTTEVDKLKALLQAEKERADEFQEKFLQAKESSTEKQNNIIEEKEEAIVTVKEPTLSVAFTEKMEPLTAEIDNSKALLESERERANEWQKKCLQAGESGHGMQREPPDKKQEQEEAVKETTVPVTFTEKIESLTAEIDNLKALLESERERADEWQNKCLHTEKSSNEMQNKSPEEEAEDTDAVQRSTILVIETEKIESVIAEVDKLKALLQSERERADKLQKKSLQAEESNNVKNNNITEGDEATVATKEALIPVVDNEKIESLTAEIDNLKTLLQSERERANELERKSMQAEELNNEKQNKTIAEEATAAVKETLSIVDTEKIEVLIAEIDNLKVLLQSESERADEWEKKCLQAQESSNEKQNILLEDADVTAEVDELKALLQSERERADEWEKKCLQAEESCKDKQKEPIEEEQEGATIVTNEGSPPAVDTEKIDSLTAEIDELRTLLKSERERAIEWEKKCLQKEPIEQEQEKITIVVKEPSVPVVDTEKIDSLTAEIDELKILLKSERDRADEWERKCLEAVESITAKQESTGEVPEEATAVVKEASASIADTEKINSLTAEIHELKTLLKSERERADEWEKKCLQVEESINEKGKELTEEEHEEATAVVKEASVSAVDSEKSDSLDAEIDELKTLLKSERARADEWEKKCKQAEESINEKRKEPTESEQEATTVAKDASVSVVDTEKIDSLTAEIDELKTLLKSERDRADEWEKKCLQGEESSSEKQKEPTEEEEEEVAIKEALVQVQDTVKIESLVAELNELRALLQAETERADEWQFKCLQAEESNNEMQKQLEETEKRVQQLEESVNRVEK